MMKIKEEFEAVMINKFTEEEFYSNGGYHCPAENASLYIKKNGVCIELNEEEIKKLVKSIGANFKR